MFDNSAGSSKGYKDVGALDIVELQLATVGDQTETVGEPEGWQLEGEVRPITIVLVIANDRINIIC